MDINNRDIPKMQTTLFRRTAILMEQHPLHSKLYKDILTANGFDVSIAKSAVDGLMQIKNNKHDLVIINTEIAEEAFIGKLVGKIQSDKATQDMPIVGLSIYSKECKKNISKIMDAFLTKPLSIDKFMESIFACIENKSNGCQSTSS
jgi:response regulator RpfG family c-di-GMP phosphodiesterase